MSLIKFENIRVKNRQGQLEMLSPMEIKKRLVELAKGLNMEQIDIDKIAENTLNGIFDGVTTRMLDTLSAEVAVSYINEHPDYGILAARIEVSNLHKSTLNEFSKVVQLLYNDGKLTKQFYDDVQVNAKFLDERLYHEHDFDYSYFGFKTLEKNFLLRIGDTIVERPQHMLMRVAVAIHKRNLKKIEKTYRLMSIGYFTHASPTLFMAGTKNGQLSSCFLMPLEFDYRQGNGCPIGRSLDKIFNIAMNKGGIGIDANKIPARGDNFAGIVPVARLINASINLIDTNRNFRPSGIALYIEPWHADIFDFLKLRRNIGSDEKRARDLFCGLWIPDLFMKCVRDDENWYLMCPLQSSGLAELYGASFERRYYEHVQNGRFKCVIKARELWKQILTSQIETGTPYISPNKQ